MFDTQYGLVNWALGRQGESWLAHQLAFFVVATIIVVWMGIPFIAFTVYAGLTQIPVDLHEAAELDGAGFVTLPLRLVPGAQADPADPHVAVGDLGLPRVHPDLRAAEGRRGHRDTNLLGVYAYSISIGENRFDIGAAVAVVMVAITGS